MPLRSVFDAGDIKREFENAGLDPKFVPIIWKHVIQNQKRNGECEEFDWEKQVPWLPSAAYSLLRSRFKKPLSSVHSVFHSADNLTTKLLIIMKQEEKRK
ncbi:hypothetical protein QN277_005243 [Acacia crassicarpa]|uniref:Uncharacterized protein n=1 Tax=Acacia crassicarpa TaxID=499986 RepID=A0AAE1IXL5_9FABA|nr:hypothetical protein QN277_005243 [Acacia crassicarpa]